MTTRPILEVLLSLVDNISGPIRQAAGSVNASAKTMQDSLGKLKEGASGLIEVAKGFLSFEAIKGGLEKAFTAADELEQSLRKLKGTSELTGVPMETLTGLAEEAAAKFGLTKTTANDFAGAVATIANRAGKLGESQGLMSAFLDLTTAKGKTSEQAMEALEGSLRGNDKAMAKLLEHPTASYYDKYATSVGKTVSQLDNHDKALALVNGLMEEGGKVAGSYAAFLETADGKQQVAAANAKNAWATVGAALDNVQGALAEASSWLATKVVEFVGGMQIWGADIALFFLSIPDKIKWTAGQALVAIGTFLTQTLGLIPFLGDMVDKAADAIATAGAKMEHQAAQSYANLKQAHEEVTNEIVAGEAAMAKKVSSIHKENQDDLDRANAEAAAKAAERRDAELKKTLAAQEKAREGLAKITQEFLKDFGGEVPSAVADLNAKIAGLLKQADEWSASTDPKIRAQADAVRDLAMKYMAIVPTLTALGELAADVAKTDKDPDRIRALHDMEDELARAQTLRAMSLGNTKALNDADKVIADLEAKIGAEKLKQVETNQKVAQQMHDQLPTLQQIHAEVDAIRAKEEARRKAAYDTARDILGQASNMGLVSNNTRDAIGHAIDLADKMSKVLKATEGFTKGLSLAAAGDLVGAVMSFGALLGSLFGDSPETRRREALIVRNNDQLQGLTAVMEVNSSGGKIAAFNAAAGGAGASPQDFDRQFGAAFDVRASTKAKAPRYSVAGLSNVLAAKGMTFGDVAQMARDFGIDLDLNDGTVDAQALYQLFQATSQYHPKAFGSDYGGEVGFTSYQNSINGGSGLTLGDYQRILSGANGSRVLAGLFAGLDLNNPNDLQTLIARAQALGLNINNLSPADLGGLNVNQFKDAIAGIISGANTAIGNKKSPAAPSSSAGASVPDAGASLPDTSTPVAGAGSGVPSGWMGGSSSGGGSVAPYTLPSGGSLVVADAAGWGFKSLADFLGPKMDLTNMTLTAIRAEHGALLHDIAVSTGAVRDELGASGGLLTRVATGLATQADLTAVNRGTTP